MADVALTLRDIRPGDAGEVLTLQRASFVSEALIYGTVQMPALTQSLESLAAELEKNLGCVAVRGHRIVGAARGQLSGDLLLIGRMTVAPDQQGNGIGARLLAAVEQRGRDAGATEAELFTGSLSEANLRLYQREGYVETERVHTDAGIDEVYLRKPLT